MIDFLLKYWQLIIIILMLFSLVRLLPIMMDEINYEKAVKQSNKPPISHINPTVCLGGDCVIGGTICQGCLNRYNITILGRF